jgi:plastocyanin
MGTRTRLAPFGGATMRLFAPILQRVAILSVILMAFAWAMHAAVAETMVEITIDNFTFTPATLTIEPGTTVKWLNRDDIPHMVAAKSLAFKSPALDTDDSFSQQLNEVGEIDYFCSLHPHMTGKVIIRARRK